MHTTVVETEDITVARLSTENTKNENQKKKNRKNCSRTNDASRLTEQEMKFGCQAMIPLVLSIHTSRSVQTSMNWRWTRCHFATQSYFWFRSNRINISLVAVCHIVAVVRHVDASHLWVTLCSCILSMRQIINKINIIMMYVVVAYWTWKQ